MALFITFEGGDGCGKSTQSRLLYNRLNKLAVPAVLTREPGGTALGDRVRRLLKRNWNKPVSSTVELLLFNACRAQLVDTVIRPALNDGTIVICDRFADSTVAYQGYGRGLDMTLIKDNNQLATGGLKPDLTILLDMPVEQGLSRKTNSENDRFESETVQFHCKVREGFLRLANDNPERWLVIDARQSKEAIRETIWHRVTASISRSDR